jgi:hypothetical protein
LLAYIYFKDHDPAWVRHARSSIEVAGLDGGSTHQREVLATLPVDVLDASEHQY